MATEKDAVPVETSTAPVVEEAKPETEIEKIRREADEWKDRAMSAEGRRRKLEVQVGDSAESEDRMAQFFVDSLRTVIGDDDPEKARKIEEIAEARVAARHLSTRVSIAQEALQKLEAGGLDWEKDPDLATARTAWDAGRPEDALKLAEAVVKDREIATNYTHNDDVEQVVNDKLKNARQDAQDVVDTGQGTAPRALPDNKPTNMVELRIYLASAQNSGVTFTRDERQALYRGAGLKTG